MNIAIIGATGYSGAELIRLLHQHPEANLHTLHSSSKQNTLIKHSYPHFDEICEKELEDIDAEKIARENDVVFLATPSGVSTQIIPQFMNKDIKIIDISGDFRIKDQSEFKKWYKKEPAEKALLNQAVYGLTEWLDRDYETIKLLSNPGCFPTAALLGLIPLVKGNLIDKDSIIIDGKTGVSGAGRTPSAVTHFSETSESFKIYKVNKHQHIPEIEQVLNEWGGDEVGPVTFSTHLVPMTRGIMTTTYAKATTRTSEEELVDLFKETYKDNYFVRVRAAGEYPSTREVYGSNFCDIGITFDDRTGRITVVSVVDNLTKGASGQAVQNMNKMFGFNETLGLDFVPVYP